MADDIQLPGMGESVGTDKIGSKHYQRIKLIHGADGVNDGDVAKDNPLPNITNLTLWLKHTVSEAIIQKSKG